MKTFSKHLPQLMHKRTTGLNQPGGGDQISEVLCPDLESLQIEDINFTEQSELMPVLKDVALRAAFGWPVKN